MFEYNKARVGNIVGYDLFLCRGIPFLLTAMVTESIFNARSIYNNAETTIHKRALLPIPLTIQRLQKLNFRPVGSYWVYKDCWLASAKEGFTVSIGKEKANITAVHQLQNFFFEQTHSELPLPFTDASMVPKSPPLEGI